MAPLSWVAPLQGEFLLSNREGHARAQAGEIKFSELWDGIMAEWIQRWPLLDEVFPGENLQVSDLDASQHVKYQEAYQKLKGRIKTWCNWRFNPWGRTNGGSIPSKDMKAIYNGQAQGSKDYEVFNKLFPGVVSEHHDNICKEKGLRGRKKIGAWQTNCKEAFLRATSEEREAVQQKMKEDDDEGTEDAEQTPEQYQHYLDILPRVLTKLVDLAVRKAGVMAVLTIVGPVPKEEGKIASTSLQFGDKEATPLFSSWWSEHDAVFLEELGSFARRYEFSPQLCAKRALSAGTERGKELPGGEEAASEDSTNTAPASPSAEVEATNSITAPSAPGAPNGMSIPAHPNDPSATSPSDTSRAGGASQIGLSLPINGSVNPNVEPEAYSTSSTSLNQLQTSELSSADLAMLEKWCNGTAAEDWNPEDLGDLDNWANFEILEQMASPTLKISPPPDMPHPLILPNTARPPVDPSPIGLSTSPYGSIPNHATNQYLAQSSVPTNYPAFSVPTCPDLSVSPGEPASNIMEIQSQAQVVQNTTSSSAFTHALPNNAPLGNPQAATLSAFPASSTFGHANQSQVNVSISCGTASSSALANAPSNNAPPGNSQLTTLPSSSTSVQGPMVANQAIAVPTSTSSSTFATSNQVPSGSSQAATLTTLPSSPTFTPANQSHFNVNLTCRTTPANAPSSNAPPATSQTATLPIIPVTSTSSPKSTTVNQSQSNIAVSTVPPSNTPADNVPPVAASTPSNSEGCNQGQTWPTPSVNPPRPSNAPSPFVSAFKPTQRMSLALHAHRRSIFSQHRDSQSASVAGSPMQFPLPNPSQQPKASLAVLPPAQQENPRQNPQQPILPQQPQSLIPPFSHPTPLQQPNKTTHPEQPETVPTPQNALSNTQHPPDWFIIIYGHLTSYPDLGEDWKILVAKWGQLERLYLYGKGSKGLPPKNRPEEWLKNKPKLLRKARLATMKWWKEMQHPFRLSSPDNPMPLPTYSDSSIGDVWSNIRKFGSSGLVSLLTLMFWWGRAAATSTDKFQIDSRPLWNAMVIDVDKCFDELLAMAPSLKRRSEDDDTLGGPAEKRLRSD
ncbi:hypothetical protein EST38_g12467 [Candolleomyces aberdarensis]|uniref:Uncharacterized protein n=1 Tax=Candolleomyces aberdarensis TaxID=2316362 RepID=A0A4Q2D4C4_9AGAR|nr:hypothetical protein EST38_g12467 [Candolleomyces aberdarensis]